MLNYPQIILGQCFYTTAKEKKMVEDSFVVINKALSSDLFKQKILAAKFTETQGYTNQQIYNIFCSVAKTVNIEFFNGNWRENYIYKTYAYEGDGKTVRFNRYFVKTIARFASIVPHEVLGHGFGFRHDYNKSTSIPYQLNRIFDATCAELKLL